MYDKDSSGGASESKFVEDTLNSDFRLLCFFLL